MQTEKMSVFRASTCDSGNIFFIKTFVDQETNHFTCCRWVGTWFQDDCVSGCDGVYQRFDGKKERIVPWTHDKNHTVWRWFTETVGVELCQRSGNGLFLCIGVDIFQHMCDLGEYQAGFAHVALEIAFSKIFFQSSVNLMLVFSDGGTKTFQGADTKIKI